MQLIMRWRTQNIKLETTYCTKCKANTPCNIGQLKCVRCDEDK